MPCFLISQNQHCHQLLWQAVKSAHHCVSISQSDESFSVLAEHDLLTQHNTSLKFICNPPQVVHHLFLCWACRLDMVQSKRMLPNDCTAQSLSHCCSCCCCQQGVKQPCIAPRQVLWLQQLRNVLNDFITLLCSSSHLSCWPSSLLACWLSSSLSC